MSQQVDIQRLVYALQAIDEHVTHETVLPEDAPAPLWCEVVRQALGYPEGECCGVCREWSEVIIAALDAAFKEDLGRG